MRTAFLVALLTLVSATAAFGQGVETKCPQISVSTTAGVTNPGDATFVKANVQGLDSRLSITYEWKVSTGQKIIDGQGTDKINVQSRLEDAGSTIAATVTVKGVPDKCSNTASGSVDLGHGLIFDPVDNFGRIPWQQERYRLDDFLVHLKRNPRFVGLIYIQIEDDETVDKTKKHVLKMLKHFKSRDKNFDLERLRFAIYKGAQHSTMFHFVPEGARLPECPEGCTLLNGKDLYR